MGSNNRNNRNNRNKLCWCVSGKKYKKCHLNRSNQPTLTRGDLENHAKSQGSKKTCSVNKLYPEVCSKNIINAHTISKSGSLKEISENGHVMGAKPSLSGLIKSDGRLKLEKVGISKASTFTGFCSVHDKEIFSPLEDEPITLNDRQLFLLAYRGMCREFFHKEQNKGTASLMKNADRGQEAIIQNILQNRANLYDQGVDLALRDLGDVKSKMDSMLEHSNYSRINHCIFEFSETPKILVSAMIAPEMDFHGNKLQKLGLQDKVSNYILFNCISYNGRGCFIFSWMPEHNEYCRKLIDSLLKFNYEEISDALVRFCYSFSENTWASPSWWDSLSQLEQESIGDRLMQGTPMALHPMDCLKDDGCKFNALKIVKHELRMHV